MLLAEKPRSPKTHANQESENYNNGKAVTLSLILNNIKEGENSLILDIKASCPIPRQRRLARAFFCFLAAVLCSLENEYGKLSAVTPRLLLGCAPISNSILPPAMRSSCVM